MTTTKFAIIGAGAISQAYAQAFQSISFQTYHEAEVVGVADIRQPVADSLAEVLNCPSFDSYTALADECNPDAVLVCTPPASHPEICHYFIERGVHVLCEKPFAVNAKEAAEVVEGAKKKGVIITMASKFRYVDDVIKAKQIVDAEANAEQVRISAQAEAAAAYARLEAQARGVSGIETDNRCRCPPDIRGKGTAYRRVIATRFSDVTHQGKSVDGFLYVLVKGCPAFRGVSQ